MSERSDAPWSDEEVAGLRRWQACDWVHAFTCPNHDDADHVAYREDTGSPDALVVDNDGWICEWCNYQQGWAHRFMLAGPPPEPADMLKGPDHA